MGSVHTYETTTGKRYRVTYRKPDHSQGTKRGFKTKRDAEVFLASVVVSKAKGEFVDAGAARMTVDALGKEWLNNQSHLKPSSHRPIESAWRVHVAPHWGARSVGSIRPSEVQAWVSQLGATRGATSVIRAYGVLAAVLDVALKDRRVSVNPARGVTLPRKGKKSRIYLSHNDVQRLADESGEWSTLILFLAYTGLRWGEATGLRVRHVDALKRRVNVSENAVALGAVVHVGTPKSHEARSVPYPRFLAEPVASLCEGKGRDELVFGGGLVHVPRPKTSEGMTSWFLRALKLAGLERMTIHDLRHTAASLAISSGANVKAVQRILGHASAAMTLDTYADLFEDDLDAVSDALDAAKNSASVVKMLSRGAQVPAPVALLPSKHMGFSG
jgi:integrase